MDKIEKLDLSKNPRLDKVRDILIMNCYLGLRYEDLAKLTKDHFVENASKMKLTTKKTGSKVIVPLHRKVKAILAKYGGKPPEMMRSQKLNDYYKELGEKAKINNTEIIISTVGGKRQEDRYKKYELMATHIGRRTFATRMIRAKMDKKIVMMFTGHTKEESFDRYVGITEDETANEMMNHPFFNE